MTAKDYPVTFAYGDVDGVYYTNRNPHRGNDRPSPSGTPIIIGSTTIGWTGNTGLTSGPHLHTQAGVDEWCQSTVEPSPYEFQPGTVVNAGYGSQWGNYIIIKTGGHYICYAHLSDINVNIGQVIGVDMITKELENTLSFLATGDYPGKGYDYRWTGQPLTESIVSQFVNFWLEQSRTVGLTKRVKEVEGTALNKDAVISWLNSNIK